MARTLDPAAHAVRRDAFVDAGQMLVQTRGYEGFSIADVLEVVGASKGAFYHYFDSKDALVSAVVERMADQATVVVGPVLEDRSLTAIQKLEALFGGMAQFKAERKDLALAILRVWLSDDNAVVRELSRRLVTQRLVPWLKRIVAEGIAEGTFHTRYPDQLALVLAALIQGVQDLSVQMWVGRQLGTVTIEEVKRTFAAYMEAFERIVGVPPGSLVFLDEPTIEFWFG